MGVKTQCWPLLSPQSQCFLLCTSPLQEIYPPNVNDFVFITDNTYTREQMVAMEETILQKLSYELTVPTSKTFLRRYLQVRTLCVCVCVWQRVACIQPRSSVGFCWWYGGWLGMDASYVDALSCSLVAQMCVGCDLSCP